MATTQYKLRILDSYLYIEESNIALRQFCWPYCPWGLDYKTPLYRSKSDEVVAFSTYNNNRREQVIELNQRGTPCSISISLIPILKILNLQ